MLGDEMLPLTRSFNTLHRAKPKAVRISHGIAISNGKDIHLSAPTSLNGGGPAGQGCTAPRVVHPLSQRSLQRCGHFSI